MISGWTRVGTVTLAAATGASIVTPTDALIATNLFKLDVAGSMILLIPIYDRASTAVASDAVVGLMGRKTGSGVAGFRWMKNKASTPSTSTTLVTNCGTTTLKDTDDGVFFKYGTPDIASQAYDNHGYDEFLLFVITAIGALTGGSTASTGVQFKIL